MGMVHIWRRVAGNKAGSTTWNGGMGWQAQHVTRSGPAIWVYRQAER